jgi:serine protease inhibitor
MKPQSRLLALALALLLLPLAGCSDEPTGPGEVAPITELPRALSAVEREILAASNRFAFSLGKELAPARPTDNLFYSPLSASMLLGMVLNGADGRTYDQMRGALAFDGLSQQQINQGYSDLMELLLQLDPSVTIDLGSSIWTGQGFPVLPDFLERVRSSFDAQASTVSFADPATLPRINKWASDATRGRIETIFDELPASTVMVLLNAIYFKASWTDRFDPARTQSAPFTRADGSRVTAQLMYQDYPALPIRRGDGVTVAELPYGGGAFTMVVALPDAGTPATDVLKGLTAEKWARWMGELTPGRMVVRLPRFELEWEKELNAPLQKLGMVDAFGGGADFRRMTPGGGVWLDVVKQKSFVKVDEDGTEAAAVTGGVMVTSLPPEMRMDRPFLFALRERFSGTILFMGILNDPTS